MGKTDRWLQVGGTLSGVSAGGAVAYWIYTLQSATGTSMWPWPGWGFVGACLLGVCMMAPALLPLKPEKGMSGQKIRSGNRSRNYQAGGDIRIGSADDES